LQGHRAGPRGKRESLAGKYPVFYLGREQLGIRVPEVREVTGIQDTTAVPQTPGVCA
jgi:chemotaxis signal transduction protein